MPARLNGEITGVKDAIKSLRQIDPELRKQFTKDAKKVAQPIIDDAKSSYPEKLLSGMARPWRQGENLKFPYSQANARKGVRFKVDTSRKAVSIIKVQQKDVAASIVEYAGRKRSNKLGNNLDKFGRPSRYMWPAAEKNLDTVTREINGLVKEMMDTVSRELK